MHAQKIQQVEIGNLANINTWLENWKKKTATQISIILLVCCLQEKTNQRYHVLNFWKGIN